MIAARAVSPPMKSSTSFGSTGMMMPIANMSSRTVTKTNAKAARRGPGAVGSVMVRSPPHSDQCRVVAVANASCGKLGRCKAGHRPTFADQVRLVEVAAVLRHLGPVARDGLHALEDALESLNARIDLGRQ